ncbi:YggT family protein [Agrococcus sp. UYP10]|uniref:YggT family protein n=1 Tax=Agrococcus jenensis TaxID=46353 RepID=A0A3N2AUQ2_9MICO|nr:YggT family protein [Agrococcus jenensis]ROR66675.1 YggT family protein [Agrococcus jenensis]
MPFVSILAWIVYTAANLALYILWARIILDLVRQLRRDWKPSGFWLVLSVWLLRVTDPPLRLVRRVVRPVRVGGVMLDLAMLVLMLALIILIAIVNPFRFA